MPGLPLPGSEVEAEQRVEMGFKSVLKRHTADPVVSFEVTAPGGRSKWWTVWEARAHGPFTTREELVEYVKRGYRGVDGLPRIPAEPIPADAA